MKRLKIYHWLFLLLLIGGTAWILSSHNKNRLYENEGSIFGTFYHIKYVYSEDLQADILKRLYEVDASLSAFNPNSILSRINRNEDVLVDSLFAKVFNLSMQVSRETDGAFDITIAPLVNAWGFGPQGKKELTREQVDSLLQFVGYKKIRLTDGKVVKADSRMQLDCNAVAKGYGVDRVAALFDNLGIKDYMVEIGGEIVAKGHNQNGRAWRIGISKPEENPNAANSNQIILNVSNTALATSGNYHNYYYKNGRKYTHTVNPKTGFPFQHTLLSASVMAPDCATADAYATAFMVMGMDEAKAVLNKHPELQAYFIYTADDGKIATWSTPGLKQYIRPAN